MKEKMSIHSFRKFIYAEVNITELNEIGNLISEPLTITPTPMKMYCILCGKSEYLFQI